MKFKFVLILTATISLALSNFKSNAQGYVIDALRLGRSSIGGTTRTLSIGGAQTSLGGDIGTLSSNPAGLGFYRRSDFAITAQGNNNDIGANYFGTTTHTDQQRDYNLENAGIVFASSSARADRGRATDNTVVSWAFGAGYTRLNNINFTTNFNGQNLGQNFSNNLAQIATDNGITSNSFNSQVAGIAYDEYLINPVSGSTTNYSGLAGGGGTSKGVIENGQYVEQGYTDESNLSLGLNFGNVVYLGAGINFENYNYTRNTDFITNGLLDPNKYVDGLEYTKSTYQTGTGINGKFGLILNLLNVIHVGGYVQTPTNYTVNEQVDFALVGLKNGNYVYPSVNYTNSAGVTQAGSYDPTVHGGNVFNLTTPYKYNGGASLILGGFGFLSADAEYINYKELSFSSNDATNDIAVNSAIQSTYKDVINYRAGAELKFGPLVLRGGYGYYPSPLTDKSKSADQTVYSGGFGIHTGHFYIDFGGVRDYSTAYRQAYTFDDGSGPLIKTNIVRTSGTVTIGTRF